MSKFSKFWPSTADPKTDYVVRILEDGTRITRDGYILDAPPPSPPITKPEVIKIKTCTYQTEWRGCDKPAGHTGVHHCPVSNINYTGGGNYSE